MPAIGQWARRVKRGRAGLVALTLYHRVESNINDDAITRCGRRLAPGPEGFETSNFKPIMACYYCELA